MTSQNLELFPDDLFARKGDALPAGDTRKGKAEVVAPEAADRDPAPSPDDHEAGGSQSGAPGVGEDAQDEAAVGDARESDEPAARRPGKAKRSKATARTGPKGRAAAEAAPAASVLKFRLLDEVSEDLDEILRCAEERPTPPAEAAEPEDAIPEAPPEAPEVGMPEARPAEIQSEATAPKSMAFWRAAPWTTWARATAVLLLLAGGLLAGWYAAMPNPEGSPSADNETTAVEGQDEAPAAARNALKTLGELESQAPTDGEAPAETEGDAPRVDVVRVEEDGSAVIAGMAAPGAELIVLHNGAPIGVAQADAFGQWLLLPEDPLAEGPHEFGLVVKTVEGSVTLPDPAAPQSDAPAAGASGGEAGDPPALDQESRLPAPEPASKPAQAFAEAPLPPQKPATKTATSPLQDKTLEPSYVVQLASAPSAEGAASEWQRLLKAHPDLLAGQDLAVQEAELAGRGAVFRVRTGSFETLVAARRFCAAFRRQKQDCLVVKQPETGETPPAGTRLTRNHSW